MGAEDPPLGIPALRENPFHGRPLESGKSNLLVGREELSASWSRFLKQRNPRMVLLIGENGSGRTSLMRCLAEETGKYVHLDMFPSANRAKSILDEIFSSLIGFEIPGSTQELVSKLVQFTDTSEGPMPLISLDYSNADGKELSDAVSALMASLERLCALVVITLTTDQRAQWPESLIQRFDHKEVLMPLDKSEVSELCQLRMASVSRTGWQMPEEALEHLMEKSSGMPTRVMRIMRDMVEYERSNPREVKYEPEVVQSLPEPSDEEIEQDEALADSATQEENDFDLDLDALEQDKAEPIVWNDNPLPVATAGPFGGIAARNRSYTKSNPSYDKNTAPRIPEPANVDSNQLWMEEGSEPTLIQEEYTEEPLFQDNTVEEFEPPPQPNIEISNDGLLTQFVEALRLPNGMGLADLLAAMRRPVIGQRESNSLDVTTLRNLSRSEAILVEIGSERKFSPSDARLLDRLNIKRPRLSQMCNRLYRAGIMSAQQDGRSRMFSITNDAKAQLIAWGMMEGDQ